jgi:hypothetical protein
MSLKEDVRSLMAVDTNMRKNREFMRQLRSKRDDIEKRIISHMRRMNTDGLKFGDYEIRLHKSTVRSQLPIQMKRNKIIDVMEGSDALNANELSIRLLEALKGEPKDTTTLKIVPSKPTNK